MFQDSEEDSEDDLDIPEEEILRIRQEEDEVDYKETAAPMEQPGPAQGSMSPGGHPGSPPGTPGVSVGFYIGDESLGKKGQSITPAASDGSLQPPSLGDTSKKGSSTSVAATKFKRQSSAEPQPSPMFEEIEDEPLVSQHAAQMNLDADHDPNRKGSLQSASSAGKVQFFFGECSRVCVI